MTPRKTTRKTVTKKITGKPGSDSKKNAKKSGNTQKKGSHSREEAELTAILAELNRDEINWLITQAKTMVYNHKVEEVNRAGRNLAESKKLSAEPVVQKTGSSQSGSTETIDIVQAGGPKSFNIITGNARLFLNLEELKAMVKIAGAAVDTGDGAGRLYRWCRRERNDILIDGGITGPADKRLKKLFSILRDRFTLG